MFLRSSTLRTTLQRREASSTLSRPGFTPLRSAISSLKPQPLQKDVRKTLEADYESTDYRRLRPISKPPQTSRFVIETKKSIRFLELISQKQQHPQFFSSLTSCQPAKLQHGCRMEPRLKKSPEQGKRLWVVPL